MFTDQGPADERPRYTVYNRSDKTTNEVRTEGFCDGWCETIRHIPSFTKECS